MTQADSVLSTPPTNTSVTRRKILGTIAIGTVAALASTAAEPATAAAVSAGTLIFRHSTPDPVFGLIEAHRKAARDHAAALVEQNRLERLGDKAGADWVSEAPCHAEYQAFDVLLSAAATTVPGIVAKLAYLQDIAERDEWMFDDRQGCARCLIEGFAASIANILAVQS
jgi:hypothetical protein